MKKNTIVELVSYAFALLFLYTGLMKLIDHQLFRQALNKSPLLYHFTPILALSVPIGELLIATFLMSSKFKRLGLYWSFTLMLIFTLYVGYMIYFRPHELPCSCGGIIQQMSWHQHFYFNTTFTILAAIALWLYQKQKKRIHEDSPKLFYK